MIIRCTINKAYLINIFLNIFCLLLFFTLFASLPPFFKIKFRGNRCINRSLQEKNKYKQRQYL